MLSSNTETIIKTVNKLLNNLFIKMFPLQITYKKHIAFALAEVLISLLIIGVVSSLVIPVIVQDIQNTELKTAWKNTYSIIEQASRRILIDNGGSFQNAFSSNPIKMRNLFASYVVHVKNCSWENIQGNCWHFDNVVKNPDNSSYTGTDAGLLLNNGAMLIFEAWSSCDYPIDNVAGRDPACGNIVVDVNGFKGPNRVGKDVFKIWVQENKVRPTGSLNDGYPVCENTGKYGGWTCATKYLSQ